MSCLSRVMSHKKVILHIGGRGGDHDCVACYAVTIPGYFFQMISLSGFIQKYHEYYLIKKPYGISNSINV